MDAFIERGHVADVKRLFLEAAMLEPEGGLFRRESTNAISIDDGQRKPIEPERKEH
jgi:hypothetical protein